LHSAERRTKKVSFSAGLKIEGTNVYIGSGPLGWRITTTDGTTGQEHEYWFMKDEYFTCNFQFLHRGLIKHGAFQQCGWREQARARKIAPTVTVQTRSE
jgi:hypothetical protein